MGCLLQLLASTLITENSAVALNIGWVSNSTYTPALSALVQRISLRTIKLDSGGNADRIMCHNAIGDAVFEEALSVHLPQFVRL